MRAHVTTAGHLVPWRLAAGAGLALGIAYTLSPLTVAFVAALFPLWRVARLGLSDRERYWLATILIVAIAIRLLVISGLVLVAAAIVAYLLVR